MKQRISVIKERTDVKSKKMINLNNDPQSLKWGKSKSIDACDVKMNTELKRIYETIANLVNLKIIYILKEVATLGEG